jgi:beta-galactosidase
LGALWYRLDVDVPASAAGKRVKIHCMAAETEAWVWVNGQCVGHRPYAEAFIRPNAIDLDVTDALKPGQRNSVVVRVHTNDQPAQMAGGLVGRLFLYSPLEASQ